MNFLEDLDTIHPFVQKIKKNSTIAYREDGWLEPDRGDFFQILLGWFTEFAHWMLLWIEPEDYDYTEKDQTPEFVVLMEWFLESELILYFSDETL